MIFNVTEDHIKKGRRGSRSCPIALAMMDVLSPLGYFYISVGKSALGGISFKDNKISRFSVSPIPSELKDFIIIFDELIEYRTKLLKGYDEGIRRLKQLEDLVKPFSFELSINSL